MLFLTNVLWFVQVLSSLVSFSFKTFLLNPHSILKNILIFGYLIAKKNSKIQTTIMIQSFRTNRSGQTVQTQISLLLEEQSDQGLHCLIFRVGKMPAFKSKVHATGVYWHFPE